MKLSLSTNWCNRRIESGEEIADLALSLGFQELELGYHTTPQQAKGFKARRDAIPVGTVHAFCPVPISAPHGYPELYSLASFNAEDRKMAQIQIKRSAQFAAEMGADTVVLHAGRVLCNTLFKWTRGKKRVKRGLKMLNVITDDLWCLASELQHLGVTLALENLPYFEGFPHEWEMAEILKMFHHAPIKAWFDTGHHRVGVCNGWIPTGEKTDKPWELDPAKTSVPSLPFSSYVGMHLNDVTDVHDNHYAPGFGKVDFAALKPLAESVKHVVFEPNSHVTGEDLRSGIAHIRKVWELPTP